MIGTGTLDMNLILRPEDWIVPALAQEELLDAQDPLRHLMHADVDKVTTDDTDDELPGSKDYLSVLPRQSHSIKDKILLLTFQRNVRDQCLISISLFMDASPGCGGIAWPAGQVRMCISLPHVTDPSKDPVKLHRQEGLGISARQNHPRTRKRNRDGGTRSRETWRKGVDNRPSVSRVPQQASHSFVARRPLLGIMRKNVEMNHLESCVTAAELNWCVFLSSAIGP
jgi:hypothetical protein